MLLALGDMVLNSWQHLEQPWCRKLYRRICPLYDFETASHGLYVSVQSPVCCPPRTCPCLSRLSHSNWQRNHAVLYNGMQTSNSTQNAARIHYTVLH